MRKAPRVFERVLYVSYQRGPLELWFAIGGFGYASGILFKALF